MDASFYNSPEWRRVSLLARERDGFRCTVARLLGGRCRGLLHGHHIDPDDDPLDLDNVGTACAAHHPVWEALRRAILKIRERGERPRELPPCRHRHPYRIGREACDRDRMRRAGILD